MAHFLGITDAGTDVMNHLINNETIPCVPLPCMQSPVYRQYILIVYILISRASHPKIRPNFYSLGARPLLKCDDDDEFEDHAVDHDV